MVPFLPLRLHLFMADMLVGAMDILDQGISQLGYG
jgi:hypothetical protein